MPATPPPSTATRTDGKLTELAPGRSDGARHIGNYRLPVVLVAFVLVLLAAASFAAGIAASRTSDTLVYVSIAFSLGAFAILAVASFRARQAERETAPEEGPAPAPGRIEKSEAHAGPLLGGLDPTQLDMTPSWRRQARVRTQMSDIAEEEDLDAQLENEEDEADFEVPIAAVTPGAAGEDEFSWALHDDDLEARQREREAPPIFVPPLEQPTVAFAPEDDEVDEADVLDVDEPEEPPAAATDGSFFDEYDDLTAAEIVPFLRALDLEGLKWVHQRERAGAKRATVMTQVEQLIVERGGRTTAPRKRAAAKKAAPARRAAKKSTRRR
jgi:hypothetical protein